MKIYTYTILVSACAVVSWIIHIAFGASLPAYAWVEPVLLTLTALVMFFRVRRPNG